MNLGDEAKWVLGLEANQMQGTLRNPSQIGDSLRGSTSGVRGGSGPGISPD